MQLVRRSRFIIHLVYVCVYFHACVHTMLCLCQRTTRSLLWLSGSCLPVQRQAPNPFKLSCLSGKVVPASRLFSLSWFSSKFLNAPKCIFILSAYLIQFDKVGIKDHKYRAWTKELVTLQNSANLLVWSGFCCNAFYFSYHVNWVPWGCAGCLHDLCVKAHWFSPGLFLRVPFTSRAQKTWPSRERCDNQGRPGTLHVCWVHFSVLMFLKTC